MVISQLDRGQELADCSLIFLMSIDRDRQLFQAVETIVSLRTMPFADFSIHLPRCCILTRIRILFWEIHRLDGMAAWSTYDALKFPLENKKMSYYLRQICSWISDIELWKSERERERERDKHSMQYYYNLYLSREKEIMVNGIIIRSSNSNWDIPFENSNFYRITAFIWYE